MDDSVYHGGSPQNWKKAMLAGFLLLLAAGFTLAPAPALADEAAILARLDRLEARIEARLSALESRFEGRSAQAVAAPAPMDAQAQILNYYQTVIAAKAMKSLAATFDEPKGFLEQAFGGDSAIPAIGVLAVILKALGGSVALGF